jgi:predicted transcriptional regulator
LTNTFLNANILADVLLVFTALACFTINLLPFLFMKKNWLNNLSRRERQIIEIVYLKSSVSVGDVISQMTDAPSYSAVRTFMGILEDKGHLKHKKVGAKYIYSPTRARNNTRKSALKTVFQTFFDSSVENTLAALLDFRIRNI